MNGLITAHALTLAPLLPLPWLGLGAALAVAGLLLMARRRARGTVLRAAGLLFWLGALLNPALVREDVRPIKDVAVVVVDRSPSQEVGQRRQRSDHALAALRHELAAFPDLEVKVVEQAGGDGETHLFAALRQAVADVPRRRLAGAVLITDGQVHDVPDLPADLAAFGPLHTLLTGEHDEGDRRLTLIHPPSYGIVGKTVSLTFKVEDLGKETGTGPAAAVTLRQDGGEPQVIQAPVGQETSVTVTLAHGGANLFELEVEPGPAELTLVNNHVAALVNGVRDRLRVLLVSGEPHVGERTWRNLLKADPAVDLVHFTILRPQEKQDGTPIRELSLIQFPIRELFDIKLNEFDLVIFDRYRQLNILPTAYLSNIADYVRDGGAFLEASGPSFASPQSLYDTPIGGILPAAPTGRVLEQPFLPTLTPLGRRHPVTAGLDGIRAVAAVPGDGGTAATDTPAAAHGPAWGPAWGHWFRQVDILPSRGTVVMAGAGDRPLVVLDRVGKGRVAQIASDQMWLWSRGYDGGGPAAELLRRIAHWLMKEPELEENDLSAHVEGGPVGGPGGDSRLVVERRALTPDPRPVTVTAPSGAETSLPLTDTGSLGRGDMAADEPGIWRVRDGERTAVAVVGRLNPPEFSDMRTTAERLAPAAQASGGGIFWLADHDDVLPDIRRPAPGRATAGSNWLGLTANGDHTVMGVVRIPLLPPWLALTLGAALLAAAWWREGR